MRLGELRTFFVFDMGLHDPFGEDASLVDEMLACKMLQQDFPGQVSSVTAVSRPSLHLCGIPQKRTRPGVAASKHDPLKGSAWGATLCGLIRIRKITCALHGTLAWLVDLMIFLLKISLKSGPENGVKN